MTTQKVAKGKTKARAKTHAEYVKKSRELRGQVNIIFSRDLRDELREIAAKDGKTMIGLLDEIGASYVKRWHAKND